MVRITASKSKLTATFGVDIKRMSYFFKDRDVVFNAKGSTARIFQRAPPRSQERHRGADALPWPEGIRMGRIQDHPHGAGPRASRRPPQ